jgi:transcriptional regulator GlxA family with amidase domain
MYVVAGRGEYLTDSGTWSVGPDTAIVLPVGRRHHLSDVPGKAMAVFVVYFSEAVGHANRQVTRELFRTQRPYVIPRHYAQSIRRTLRRMLYEQDLRPPQYQSAIRQCLAYILLELYRVVREVGNLPESMRVPGSQERVRQVLKYVASRYYEQQSLAAAARMAHVSQRHFANLCRKATGQSFVNFVNSIRCQRARRLLAEMQTPVSAIAFETGFEELSTFYRAFRKHCGRNPLSFRGRP